MGKRLLLTLFLIIPCFCIAQNNLSASRHTSLYTYVYRITGNETLALYKSDMDDLEEKFLHTLVDSFLTDSDNTPRLAAGDYLFVKAQDNSFRGELKMIGDVQYKLVNNNRDLIVALHNRNGGFISDAMVSIGKKKMAFDKATHTYRINKRKRSGVLNVNHQGVLYLFPIKKYTPRRYNTYPSRRFFKSPFKYMAGQIRRLFHPKKNYYKNYFRESAPYENHYRGFMVFNKPIYKPGDTVKLKAFILTKKGKPVNRPLLLRLTGSDFEPDTLLTTIHPYRPGGFEYKFVCNDTLDLLLDDDYLITLEELKSRQYDINEYDGDLDEDEYALKRKVLMRCKFRYEEYELDAITFTARADKKSHSRGNPAAVYLKATDENELAVPDGRVEILVTTSEGGNTGFYGSKVFLPDTLWQYSQPLDAIGETKIILPDSIFPAADFNYTISCNFLNSNNEYQTQTLNQHFYNSRHKILFDVQHDSLFVDYQIAGQSVPASGTLYAFSVKHDTLTQELLQLPAVVKVNTFASYYEVKTDSVTEEYEFKDTKSLLSYNTWRTSDSVSIKVVNPSRLYFWYTIYAGNKIITRGYNDSLVFADKVRTPKNYSLSLQYIYADKVTYDNFTIPYRDKLLNIQVNQPGQVYPGKTATIEIDVKDANGKPISDADVTAWAFTNKFQNVVLPNLPYLGKMYGGRKNGMSFLPAEPKDYDGIMHLNWERYSREMKLDTIEYFRFLHTPSLYINEEPARDSITQIAPFVLMNGDIKPVHMIYIDEVPVFFSQSQHLKQYSFAVSPGKHSLRLRTNRQMIKLDSIWVKQGVKTFIGINADTNVNKQIHLQQMPDTLTNYEKSVWSRYMLLIENNFGENYAYVRQFNKVFLVNREQNKGSRYFVTGPLLPEYTNLAVKDKFQQWFEPEGNYLFNIQKGLIKQKQLPYGKYAFNSLLSYNISQHSFRDFVLTENEIDSLWEDYLNNRSATVPLFKNDAINKLYNGRLQIDVDSGYTKRSYFIKNTFLFRYNNTDFLRVYPGNTRNLGYVQPGTYRLLLLLKGNRYIIKDSIHIRPNGLNYYMVETNNPHEMDSMSNRIAAVVNSQEKGNRADYQSNDMALIKESFNDKYLDPVTFTGMAFGQVTDATSGEPILGATIMVKGTRSGTVTNAQGNFSLKVPEHGTLIVMFVGYITREVCITEAGVYNIKLFTSINDLNEVVVVGYGTQRKRMMTGSVSVINADALQGTLAGISIRGTSSVNFNLPMIIIDGLPYDGTMADIDPSIISELKTLKDAAATAIYGARAANGVVMITTKKPVTAPDALAETATQQEGNTLRSHFRDDAFWQPRLRTDAQGKTSFTVKYPDDITKWRTFIAVVGPHKQTGFIEQAIRSFKLVSANIALPPFAIAGDSINVIGKTLNYSLDSIRLKRQFKIDSTLQQESIIGLRNAFIDTFAITAPDKDSLKLTYIVQKEDGYFDGEERSIPVYKQGTLETHGFFAALIKDTSFTFQLPAESGKIKLYAESSVLPVLLDEINRVRDYEYLCNEQLASKLIALLLKKKVYGYLKKEFREEKNILDIISKLNQGKTSAGLWGWWKNNEPVAWISYHATEALLMAQKAGYAVSMNKQLIADYLIYQVEKYHGTEQLFTLQLLHALGAKADYKRYIDTLEKRSAYLNLYETLTLQQLKQSLGMEITIDTLISKRNFTAFGSMYWGEERYNFFDNSIQNTVLMYRILREEGGFDPMLELARNYFLQKRKSGSWRNTYESALILETILPDILDQHPEIEPASITINGTAPVQTFPWAAEMNAREKITVSKKGAMPVYFTAYNQSWNTSPQKSANNFEVSSSFEKDNVTLTSLKAGEPVVLKVKVTVKADADYVMVQIPIPAGCSYKDKNQSYYNNEVHREYFKNKVSIFCSALRKGDYTFTVSLLPRYTGKYFCNPARAEMMYFPVFYGQEGMKRVRIE